MARQANDDGGPRASSTTRDRLITVCICLVSFLTFEIFRKETGTLLRVGDGLRTNVTAETVLNQHPQGSSNSVRFPPPIEELTGGSDKNADTSECEHPFVYVHDIIRDDPYADGRKIPRYLHLAWVTDGRTGRCLHYIQAQALGKWSEALPSYSIFFHEDEAVERIMKQEYWPEFPHLTNVLQCAQMRGAMLIDVWRILVLYRYGGMYTDIDIWPGPKWRDDTIPGDVDFFSFSDSWSRPTQVR